MTGRLSQMREFLDRQFEPALRDLAQTPREADDGCVHRARQTLSRMCEEFFVMMDTLYRIAPGASDAEFDTLETLELAVTSVADLPEGGPIDRRTLSEAHDRIECTLVSCHEDLAPDRQNKPIAAAEIVRTCD